MSTRALDNKVALVTGGGTGIGAGIAAALIEAGAQVTIIGRRDAPLAATAAKLGAACDWVQADVTSEADRIAAIAHVTGTHGRLDILVNNAGVAAPTRFEDYAEDEVRALVDVNLIAVIGMIRAALPALRETRGNIINISSAAARFAALGATQLAYRLSIYAAAKAGVNQLTRHLANEFGADGIRVNVVAPAATRSELSGSHANAARTQRFVDATPLGRMGEPDDIAAVVRFLAGDEARWVTGQIIDASGGMMMA